MFDPTSRYYNLPNLMLEQTGGRVVAYKARRFLPPAETLQTLATVTVAQGDRLDLITARTLGAPEQFWRICDANSAMNPTELTNEIGRTLRIPIPQAQV